MFDKMSNTRAVASVTAGNISDVGSKKQIATLKHHCGTLPFRVGFNAVGNTRTIDGGNYTQGQIDFDPNEIIANSDKDGLFWSPESNNIFFRVKHADTETADNNGVNTIAFPQKKKPTIPKRPH